MSLKNSSLLIGLIISLNLFSSDILVKETKNLISESMDYQDFNPIHAPYTDSLKYMFMASLSDYGVSQSLLVRENYITGIFIHLDRNAITEYEDSPDIIRMKTRRVYCFSTLALTSNYDKSLFYTDLAKHMLFDEIKSSDIEIVSKQLIGIKLIEILIKQHNDTLEQSDTNELKEITVKAFNFIPESYYKKISSLIKKLEISLD